MKDWKKDIIQAILFIGFGNHYLKEDK